MAFSSFDRPSAPDVLQRTAQKAYVDLIARLGSSRAISSAAHLWRQAGGFRTNGRG